MYELIYDSLTGKIGCIKKGNMSIPLDKDNTDYQEFLKWNKTQKTPLDLDSTIEPVKPEPVRNLAKEIDAIKVDIANLKTAK